MTEQITPRIIAEFVDMDGMLSGLRIRRAELNIADEALDEILCWPGGYTSKTIGPRPVRGLTKMTMPMIIVGLGLKCQLVEDMEATARLLNHSKFRVRNVNLVRNAVRIVFTHRQLKKLGSAGAKAGWAKMTPAQRSRKARKAAKARWHRRRRERMELEASE
jgi:hypothetical protein